MMPETKIQFQIRPGYGTGEPILEFVGAYKPAGLLKLVKEVFSVMNAKKLNTHNIWKDEELLWSYSSGFGDFELSQNLAMNSFFILPAPGAKDILEVLALHFEATGLMERKQLTPEELDAYVKQK
jgi:hypothetical protein